MDYIQKYLKYKNKYLELKQLLYGGEKPIINHINKINLFTNPDMEKYLNPIYGCFMCESGYISNNYYLRESNLIDSNESKIIKKMCKKIPGAIQPTNDIMQNIKPIDFGRFIAIKFINMTHDICDFTDKPKPKFFFPKDGDKPKKEKNNIPKDDIKEITNYISTFNKFISIDKNHDELYFHLILYCFWWISNNDAGIKEYYIGINQGFELINKCFGTQYTSINIDSVAINPTFENMLFKITAKPFKIYNQEWAKNFCKIPENINKTYPDCGEVTSRNLINLICFDGTKFDVNLLPKTGKILPQLIDYYETFNTFNLQSDDKILIDIDGNKLNARYAWSYIIIKYANTNINFINRCTGISGEEIHFEMNAGLSKDGKTGNFLKLIKNLLGIEKWDDIKNENIEYISDNTRDGIGDIYITHSLYGRIIIHCQPGHYHMELKKTESTEIDYTSLNTEQIKKIRMLLNEDINENYLWINFDSNLLKEYLNNEDTPNNLKIELFKLSLTNNYDSDLRRRIEINVDNEDFFKEIVSLLKTTDKVNEYKYESTNFEFVRELPNLKHLNSFIKCYIYNKEGYIQSYNTSVTDIDLTPLSNLTSIGNEFLSTCKYLQNIDLTPLSNLTSIGNGFMKRCMSLTRINLSNLSNLTSIGDYFLAGCENLRTINLSNLSNITSIRDNFLAGCENLKTINLSNLSNITSIGNEFMKGCISLHSIDITLLLNITSIGSYFLSGCENLGSINLSNLSNLESIGSWFMLGCTNLQSIDLRNLTKLTSIGYEFMSYCINLENIDMTHLTNLTSIQDRFMIECNKLKEIKISQNNKLDEKSKKILQNITNVVYI